MANDSDKNLAGFLGGLKPKPQAPEPAAAPAQPASAAPAATGGGVGFLAGLTGGQQPPVVPQPASQQAAPVAADKAPAPKPAALASSPAPTPAVPASAPAPVPAPPAREEQPQPLPPASATPAEFYARAEELDGQGFLLSAITAYRKGLDKDPDNPVAMNNLAVIYIQLERFEEARIELERAARLDADNPELFSNLGFVMRRLGAAAAAAKAYTRYLELSPDVDEAPMIREWIASVSASDTVAEVAAPVSGASKTAAFQGISPAETACLRDAERLYENGDFAEAHALYEDVLKRVPELPEALLGRGKCRIKLDRPDEGATDLSQALSLQGEDADVLYILGFALRRAGRDAEAADVYGRFLAMRPDAENADRIRDWIATVQPVVSSTPEAPAAPSTVTEPEKPKLQKQPVWASAMEAPEQTEPADVAVDAEPVAEELVKGVVGPDESPAAVAGSSAALESAQATTTATSALSPVDRMFKHGLREAEALLYNGDVDSALAKAQELVGMNPDSTEARLLIARCFGRRQEFQKAQAILQNILGADDHNAEAHLLMAQCQTGLKSTAGARMHLSRVVELEPGSDIAHRAQELLDSSVGGELGICSSCGASAPVQALKQIEGGQLCTACQEKLNSALGGHSVMDGNVHAAISQARRDGTSTARFRRVSARRGSLLRLAATLVVLVVLGIGGILSLRWIDPPLYQDLVAKIPGLEAYLGAATSPVVPVRPAPAGHSGGAASASQAATGAAPSGMVEKPAALPEEKYSFKPIPASAIAGMQYTAHMRLSDEKGADVTLRPGMKLLGADGQAGTFDANTRQFTWQPSAADAGGERQIEVTAIPRTNSRAEPPVIRSVFSVRVLPGPEARLVPGFELASYTPGDAVFMTCGKLDNGTPVCLTAVGGHMDGELVAVSAAGEKWSYPLEGRPAGVVLSRDDRGLVVVVADWWHAALRTFRLDAGGWTPMQSLPLGVRPLAVSADAQGRVIALLEDGQIRSSSGTIMPPDTKHAWKWMAVGEHDAAPGAELVLAARGRDVFIRAADSPKGMWKGLSVGRGTNVMTQAAMAPVLADAAGGGRNDLAFFTGGSRTWLEIFSASGVSADTAVLTLEESPLAVTPADIDGDGVRELVAIGRTQIQVCRRTAGVFPIGGGLVVSCAAATDYDGDGRDEVLCLTRAGRMAVIEIPDGTAR